MEEDIKNMSKEELLEYLEDISQQLDNIALDQIQFAISELQFFKEEYKKLKEENKQLKVNEEILMKTKGCLNEDNSTNCRVLDSLSYGIRAYEKTLRNSIPTSVIQNKIDELYKKQDEKDNKLSDLGFDLGTRNYLTLTEHKIQLLRELLEERNK